LFKIENLGERKMSECSCNGRQNQVSKEVFDYCHKQNLSIFDTSSTTLGIGLFHVPAPEKPGLKSAKVVAIEGITYAECLVRGQLCLGFKWFPVGYKVTVEKESITIKSIDDLRKWSTLSKCSDHSCPPSQPYCPNPCFCNSNWRCDKID
jgi:hypothetical protein